MSLLQVISKITIQRSGFGQHSCAAVEQAPGMCFVALSLPDTVLKMFMINGPNLQTVIHKPITLYNQALNQNRSVRL